MTTLGALESKSCLSIDVGGTKIATAIVDGRGNVVARDQIESTDPRSADELFARLVGSATTVLETAPVAPDVCGIGCGGPGTDSYRIVSPLNIAAWRSFPIGDRVEAAFALPTFCENDAKALTLGEGWKGAAVGEQNYLGMVVSTGVGGGIVLDGRLLHGRGGNAGHIGHVFVDPDGYADAAGVHGNLEGQASGSAIEAITGRPPSEADREVREAVGVLVGRAVASAANLLDLQLAVVAGSVALGFGEVFFESAQATIDELCRLDFSRGTRIVPAGLGPDAPLVGAAAVGFTGLGYDVLHSVGG